MLLPGDEAQGSSEHHTVNSGQGKKGCALALAKDWGYAHV